MHVRLNISMRLLTAICMSTFMFMSCHVCVTSLLR